MNEIVRKANSEIQQMTEASPLRTEHVNEMTVASQLTLGVEPRLWIGWRVKPWYWGDGFSLKIFRSMTGFSAERCPEDLNEHGKLIIETKEDGVFENVAEEGTHYFTFVLHKQSFFKWCEKLAIIRVSEHVPSAKVALGRMRDQSEIRELARREQVGKLSHKAKVKEEKLRYLRVSKQLDELLNAKPPPSDIDAVIDETKSDIRALAEALAARDQTIREVKETDAFRGLSKPDQDAILEEIEQRFDIAEIRARIEVRRSRGR